jgi:hypothetical protein
MLLRRGSPRALLTLTPVEHNSLVLTNHRRLYRLLFECAAQSFANIRIANQNGNGTHKHKLQTFLQPTSNKDSVLAPAQVFRLCYEPFVADPCEEADPGPN